jgi:hypothetical protein
MASIFLDEQPALVRLLPKHIDGIPIHFHLGHFVGCSGEREDVRNRFHQPANLPDPVRFHFHYLDVDRESMRVYQTVSWTHHILYAETRIVQATLMYGWICGKETEY